MTPETGSIDKACQDIADEIHGLTAYLVALRSRREDLGKRHDYLMEEVAHVDADFDATCDEIRIVESKLKEQKALLDDASNRTTIL